MRTVGMMTEDAKPKTTRKPAAKKPAGGAAAAKKPAQPKPQNDGGAEA